MGKFVDLTGQIFNSNKILKYVGNGRWECQCLKCGSVITRRSAQAKTTTSCKYCYINKVEENYFAKIDTKEKAYCFGLLWADGYTNSKSKTCKIDLQEQDKELLCQLKELFHFTGNVNYYIAKQGKSYRSQDSKVYRLSIVNEVFVSHLINKGLIPHREKFHFPFEAIPENLYFDFIRGYFDGNGTISVSKTNRIMVSLCGGTNILRDIADLARNYGCVVREYHRRENNPDNLTLVFTYNKDKFLNLMYQDAPIYLERKYKKYLEVIPRFSSSNDHPLA